MTGLSARLAREAGGEGLEVDARLAAEAPADVGHDHAHVVEGQLEGVAEEGANGEGRLGAGPDVDLVSGPPFDDGDMGLHGHVLDRGVGVLALDDPLGLGESLLDIALAQLGEVGDVGPRLGTEHGHIVVGAEVGVDEGGVGFEGIHVVEDRRQDLVLDLDQVDSLAGYLQRVGGHGRNGLAVVPHLLLGEDVLVDHVEAEPVVELGADEDGADSRQGLGARDVDPEYAGPRVGALLDLGVEHARKAHVARVDRLAGELLDGVDAALRLADRGEFRGIFLLKHISAPLCPPYRAGPRRRARPR